MAQKRKPVVENVQLIQIIAQIVKDQLYKGSRTKKELDIEKTYSGVLNLSYTEFGTMIIRPDIEMKYKFYFDKNRNTKKNQPQVFTIETEFSNIGSFKFIVQGARSFLPTGIIEEPYERFFLTQIQANTVEYEIVEPIHEN